MKNNFRLTTDCCEWSVDMHNMFMKYEYILIDFSVMFTNAAGRILNELNKEKNILVSPTFQCECEHILKVVPRQFVNWYRENKHVIVIDNERVCDVYGLTDTFGLARHLAQDYSVLVVEANYSLEDRIILSGLCVDIYSLFDDKLIQYTDYLNETQSREIDKSKSPLNYYKVETGSRVFSGRNSYILSDLLDSGVESEIYRICDNPKIIAKIFKEDEDGKSLLTSQKLKNIETLKDINDDWEVLWLALPTSVIYADSKNRKPVGYIMRYFDEATFFSDYPLFCVGDVREKFAGNELTVIKDILKICIKIVQQTLFLSINDIHISDYNDKNFAVRLKSDSKILMVDTDSYCCDNYVSEYVTYLDCFSKKYSAKTRLDLINMCDESLYAFVFTRLMLDSSFVPMRKLEFRFSEDKMATLTNPNIKAKWSSVPTNLQKLFTDVFHNNCSPSIGVLLYELDIACSDSYSNTKYKDVYKDVLEIIKDYPTKSPISLPDAPSADSKFLTQPFWIFVRIAVVCIVLLIWWLLFFQFCCTVPNDWLGEKTSSNSLPTSEAEKPELNRYDTNEGYYLSYSVDLDGYVEYYWNNGNSYKGNFLGGKINGNGTFEWNNGTKYEGEWKEGLFNGQGTFFFPNNDVYNSTWSNGTCNDGEYLELFREKDSVPSANGYWLENIFYGSFYQDGQWYELSY